MFNDSIELPTRVPCIVGVAEFRFPKADLKRAQTRRRQALRIEKLVGHFARLRSLDGSHGQSHLSQERPPRGPSFHQTAADAVGR